MKHLLLTLFLLVTGCSGFDQSGSSSFPIDNDNFSSNVDYQLSIQTGPYEGRLVVDQIRNSLIKILIPVGLNNSVPLGNFSSPQWSLSGSVTQDENGFKTLSLLVPVIQITQGVNAPGMATLPNGESLSQFPDAFPAGQAQHYSIALDAGGTVNLHLYFRDPYILGVFIQTPFDLATSNKYPVAQGNSIDTKGFFSTHPHKPPLNGGAFVLISLPQ